MQFTTPGAYPPLIHSSSQLLASGWHILFLGIQTQGMANTIFLPVREGCEERLLRWIEPGFRQKLHYLRFITWSIFVVVRFRPNVVYCSDPYSAAPGLFLKKLGYRVIYHEHDSPSAGEESKLPLLIRWSRRQLLRKASLLIFPNEKRLKRAQEWAGSNTSNYIVWNCPSYQELEQENRCSSASLGSGRHILQLYYHGTLVPDRSPFTILEGIALCQSNIELTLVGYTTIGSMGYLQALLTCAKELDIADRLHIKGPLSRGEVMQECRKHDVGIVMFTGDVRDAYAEEMVGASNKAFDYLSQGLAIIVPDIPAWKDLFVVPGYGIAADTRDPASLAMLFDWMAENPDAIQAMGNKGRERIKSEWNYERQCRPVLEWIEAGNH